MKGRTTAIVVLWAALVLPGLFSRGFWNPDEGRYGEVAREVWQGHGAIVLTRAGETYSEKPPLFFWAVAASQMIGGPTAPASRVPSALVTLATALMLYGMVRRTHGEDEGFLAALLLLSAQLVWWMGFWVGIDAMAMFFVMLAIWAQDRAYGRGVRETRWRVLMYLALAGAVLTKGAPVFIAVLALAGRAWLERGWRGLLPKHLLWGVPLFLGVLALWAIPAWIEGGRDYLWRLTGGQAARRLVDSDSKEQPFWYYLGRFPAHFLPSAVLLLAGIRLAWDDWKAGGSRRVRTGIYILWFALPFLVFSAISGKRERYLLPIFPAAAALVAIGVLRYRTGAAAKWLVRVPVKAMLVVFLFGGVLLVVAPFLFESVAVPRLREKYDPALLLDMSQAVARGMPILVLGGLSAIAAALDGLLRRRMDPPVIPLVATTGFLILAASAGWMPAQDRAKSVAPLIEEVVASPATPRDARWATLRIDPGTFCLSLGTERVKWFEGDDAVAEAAAALRADPRLVVFTEGRNYRELSERRDLKTKLIADHRVGSHVTYAVRADPGE